MGAEVQGRQRQDCTLPLKRFDDPADVSDEAVGAGGQETRQRERERAREKRRETKIHDMNFTIYIFLGARGSAPNSSDSEDKRANI